MSGQVEVRRPETSCGVRCDERGVVVRPRIDVFDRGEAYEIVAELPGVAGDGVALTYEAGVLTLEARCAEDGFVPEGAACVRREFGGASYERRFRLGEDIDASAIEATCERGLLRIRLPRVAAQRARRIPVTG